MKNLKNSPKSKKKTPINSLFSLIPYLKDYKLKIFFVIIALIVTSLSVLFLGKMLKYLIDFGFVAKNTQNLNLTLIWFGVFVVILAVAGYFRSSLINEVGEKIIANLRQKIYRHIIFASNEFFEITKVGDVISRLTTDTTLLYNIISNTISFFLRNIILFFGGLIFLFLSSAKLTLISLILLPLSVVPILFLGKKVKKLSVNSQEKVADLGSHIEESVNGIKTIQAYQNETLESANFNDLSQDALNVSVKKIKVRSLLSAAVILIAFGFVGTVLWLGSIEVIEGKMSAGDLSSFIFYAVITATALVSISHVMGQLQTAAGAAQRLFELLKIKSTIKETKNPAKLDEEIFLGKNLTLEFKNVNFAYPSRKTTLILNDFSLKIKNKEKIALVGPSGAGKSTILELLIRFFDIDKGQISINHKKKAVNIKDLSLKDLRSLFSYISQDCFIFSGTIFDNITYSTKNIRKEQVENLIKKSAAFDFINKFPEGLNSFVGQKGIKLSGGERQRIAILRAIINDAPILLLDEATSSLDNKNEKLVTDLINDLMQDKIVICVAHRLSTIKNSNHIVFMQNGKIIEEGNHDQLIKSNGTYKEMIEKGQI